MAAMSSNHMPHLLDNCVKGDVDRLRVLLNNADVSTEVLKEVENTKHKFPKRTSNLHILVQNAAEANQAKSVAQLINFAKDHSIPNDTIITRRTVESALSTQTPEVIAVFIEAEPSCVNMHIGYSSDPLHRAITGPYRAFPHDTNPSQRIPLVKFLLGRGADPNRHIGGFLKPGCHLYTAVFWHKPLDTIRLLLEHGAQVKETGALVAAAERGRVDVMELLVEYGGDVNEPRTERIVKDCDRVWTRQRARETPIDAARREGRNEAVRWLQDHGAA